MIEPKRTNLDWLKEQVSHDGDECLIWPFARSRGYGLLSTGDGKVRKAHRVLCEMVYGPPPTPAHEAAHSCGRGDYGCVNRKHLSWKTREGNQRDRREHGTAGNGGSGSRRKLTEAQVLEVRGNTGETVTSLAQRFGVTRSAIRQIQTGKTWKRTYRSPQRDRIVEMALSSNGIVKTRDINAEFGTTMGHVLFKLVRSGVLESAGRGIYRLTTQPKVA